MRTHGAADVAGAAAAGAGAAGFSLDPKQPIRLSKLFFQKVAADDTKAKPLKKPKTKKK